MDHILQASAVDPDCKDWRTKCDFIVQIRPDIISSISLLSNQCEVTDSNLLDDPIKRSSVSTHTMPKPYFLRAANVTERNEWIADINRAVTDHQASKKEQQLVEQNFFLRNQMRLRLMYMSTEFRVVTAVCVGLNFLTLVITKYSH
jgi:hypothetical protein